jgi:hypothetical protein
VKPNQASVSKAMALIAEGTVFSMSLAGRGDTSDPLGLTSKQALIIQSQILQSQQVSTTRSVVDPELGARSVITKTRTIQRVAQSVGSASEHSSWHFDY